MRKPSIIALVGLLCSGGFVTVSTAHAGTSTVNECRAVAEYPYKAGNGLGAKVGASGCSSSVTWTGRLKRDLFLAPDPTLDLDAGSGNRTVALYSSSCVGGNSYYSQTGTNSGANGESAHGNVC